MLLSNLTVSLQARGSPSLNVFPFDIKDYIEVGEISHSTPDTHQEEHILSAATKDRLRLMLPHLERDITDLVCNARPLLDMFLTVRGELNQDLLTVLSPAALSRTRLTK